MSDTSQNSAPASPAPAAPAAAAPASPAAAPASKPTSAVSALESAAARSAAQPVSVPGPAPNGNAGVQPAPAAAAIAQPAKPATPGPIPFAEHDKALKNARQKAADEATARFAWASGLDPDEVKEAVALRRRLGADPKKFIADLTGELGEGQEEALPEPDLQTTDGKRKAFSAEAVAKREELLSKRILGQVMEQIGPILEERKQAEQQKRVSAVVAAGRKVVDDSLTHAMTLPHFKENETAISQKLGEIPKETKQKVGPVAAMYMAYADVLLGMLAQAPATAEEKVTADFKRKAAAASGNVAPGGPTPVVAKKKPTNERELAAHMAQLASSMT